MTHIPVNAEVDCSDGLCGRSTYVVINPVLQKVTHLVVKEKRSPHTERLVPVDRVVETTPDSIRLRCTKQELKTLASFIETEYVQENVPFLNFGYEPDEYVMSPYVTPAMPIVLPLEHERIPAGELAVRRGAEVATRDGHVGRVTEFLVDPPDGHITHLVLREGHFWGRKDVTIPVSQIDRIEEHALYLKLSKRGVEALPTVPVKR